jgi:hypothetical protein
MPTLVFIVQQRDEVYVVMRGQNPEEVIGADPVAAVRRIRQPVGQKEDVDTANLSSEVC